MADFIYPLAAFVIDFICLLLTIRFLASKHGLVWILPLFMSVFLLGGSAVCLLATASDIAGETLTMVAGYVSLFLFALSVIWLINIIALGTATGRRRDSYQDQKTFNEAEYVKRKTAPETYFRNTDPRPTKAKSISPVQALDLAADCAKENKDLYRKGPVPTVKLHKSAFTFEKD